MSKIAVVERVRRIFTKGAYQMTPEGMHLLPDECESHLHSGPVAEAAAILYNPASYIPGQITRPNAPYVTETVALDPLHTFPNAGLPGKISGGLFIPITGNADAVYGILVRPYPEQGLNAADPIFTAVPKVQGARDALIKGYIGVFCQRGTPAQGSAVYVRYQNAVTGQIVGGLESGTTGDNYQLTGAIWTGAVDANGNAEIRLGSTTI